MIHGFLLEMMTMTPEQSRRLEKLYTNCRTHAKKHSADVEFWERATAAFYKLTDEAHDHELTEKAVEYYMQLQNEFCEELKGVRT